MNKTNLQIQRPTTIAILGGGIIGVTTGILLNMHGYKTKIYTEHMIEGMYNSKDRRR